MSGFELCYKNYRLQDEAGRWQLFQGAFQEATEHSGVSAWMSRPVSGPLSKAVLRRVDLIGPHNTLQYLAIFLVL